MCVIMMVDNNDHRPTSQMLEKAFDWNNDGVGVCWREGPKNKVEVLWKKGIEDYDEVEELAYSLPVPYVLHFRLTSIGGKRPALTHPFPVDLHTSLALEGRTNGYLLFHNGTWKEWDVAARYAALHTNHKIPSGKWSDSRALAWLCAIYGNGFMEFVPEQRGVLFGPHDYDVFFGPGWKKINDVWCSNDIFMSKGNVRALWGGDVCKDRDCWRKDTNSNGFCPEHARGTMGVSQTNGAPFRQDGLPIISLQLAETLWKRGDLSRGQIKDIRKNYKRLAGTEKERKRGMENLRELTQNLSFGGRRG